MMLRNYIILFSILLLTYSCNHKPKKNAVINDLIEKKALPDIDEARKIIKENIARNAGKPCDFLSLKKEFSGLNQINPLSIAFAENYIKRCLPEIDSTHKDSVFLYFNNLFYNVANTFSDSMTTWYPLVFNKLNYENEGKSEEAKQLKKYLGLFGLELLSSEGIYFVDVDPDYFYNIFNGKVSPALENYLKIRRLELAEGFSDDASMKISFEKLYHRVMTWEKFIDKYPDFILINYAYYYYNSYLSTLLTGMDNTPVFDYETNLLKPGVKTLYEDIVNDTTRSKTKEVVTGYYHFLKKNDFKLPSNLDAFMKRKGLYSMQGVQPHLR